MVAGCREKKKVQEKSVRCKKITYNLQIARARNYIQFKIAIVRK